MLKLVDNEVLKVWVYCVFVCLFEYFGEIDKVVKYYCESVFVIIVV